MGMEQNTELIRRFYDEVWNKGNFDFADGVIAPDYVRHDLRPGTAPPGPEGQKAVARLFRRAFPDLRISVELIASGADYVVGHWSMTGTHEGEWAGVAPTGRRISYRGVNIFRLSGGKVVEMWNYRDDLGLAEQLGAQVYAGYPEGH